jgi:hypothetical protein
MMDFTDPGVREYFIVLISAGGLFIVWLMIWLDNHLHGNRVQGVVDRIRARGPTATISMHPDGRVTVEQHKTTDDICRDIADEYGYRAEQVSYCGNGQYQIQPDVEDALREELTAHPL